MGVRDFDIDKLRGLDPREWERLQSEYHDRVYGYIKRQVGNPDLAEDLTQDAFLGAVRGIGNFHFSENEAVGGEKEWALKGPASVHTPLSRQTPSVGRE